MMHSNHSINHSILADGYFLREKEIKEEDKEYGTKTVPVDMNAACVWEKSGTGLQKEDLSEIESSIRERFALKAKEDFEPKKGGDY